MEEPVSIVMLAFTFKVAPSATTTWPFMWASSVSSFRVGDGVRITSRGWSGSGQGNCQQKQAEQEGDWVDSCSHEIHTSPWWISIRPVWSFKMASRRPYSMPKTLLGHEWGNGGRGRQRWTRTCPLSFTRCFCSCRCASLCSRKRRNGSNRHQPRIEHGQ